MRNVSIDVVDPNKISIQNAKTRLVEINNSNGDINFHKSIEFINKSIDLLIIATSSKIRFNVTKEVISKNSVRNIVFEKVLFQRVDEYF